MKVAKEAVGIERKRPGRLRAFPASVEHAGSSSPGGVRVSTTTTGPCAPSAARRRAVDVQSRQSS